MQKDIVPSGQKRFIAEKSQKEIAQKGAERESGSIEPIENRFRSALDPVRFGPRRGVRRVMDRQRAAFSARNIL